MDALICCFVAVASMLVFCSPTIRPPTASCIRVSVKEWPLLATTPGIHTCAPKLSRAPTASHVERFTSWIKPLLEHASSAQVSARATFPSSHQKVLAVRDASGSFAAGHQAWVQSCQH